MLQENAIWKHCGENTVHKMLNRSRDGQRKGTTTDGQNDDDDNGRIADDDDAGRKLRNYVDLSLSLSIYIYDH